MKFRAVSLGFTFFCLLLSPCYLNAAPSRDLNGDLAADPTDLVALVHHVVKGADTQFAPSVITDINGDGVVDFNDLDVLAAELFSGRPVIQSAVGKSGGVLGNAEFQLIIPSGVLSKTETITVIETTDPSSVDLPGIRRFQIYGLPADYSGGIKVRLRDNAPSSRTALSRDLIQTEPRALSLPTIPGLTLFERRFIGVKAPSLVFKFPTPSLWDYAAPGLELAFMVAKIEAEKAYQWLAAELPPLGIAAAEAYELFVLTTDISVMSKNQNFELMLTEAQLNKGSLTIPGIANALEDLRTKLADTFGMEWSTLHPIPIRILFRNLPPNVEGEAISSSYANFGDYIALDEKFLTDGTTVELETLIAHELMHILQNQYDPRYIALRRKLMDVYNDGNMYLWWNEAVSVYVEDIIAKPGTMPLLAMDYFYEPYEAFHKYETDRQNTARHGYGMSSLVKYIVEDLNNGDAKIIGRIYKGMRDFWFWYVDGVHPVDVILKAVNPGTSADAPAYLNWWREFFISYLQGSIYPNVNQQLRAYVTSKQQVLTPVAGMQSSFFKVFSAKDMSATPFIIDFSGYGTPQPGEAVTISALEPDSSSVLGQGTAGLMAFKLPRDGRPPVWLAGEGTEGYLTVQVPPVTSDSSDVLFLLFQNRHVSDYLESKDIFLDVKMGNKRQYTIVNGSTFEIEVIPFDETHGPANIFPISFLQAPGYYYAHYGPETRNVTFGIKVVASCTPGDNVTLSVRIFGETKPSQPVSCSGVPYTAIVSKNLSSWLGSDTSVEFTLEKPTGILSSVVVASYSPWN